jgi:O-antigen/teichoic acid export membrane protein
MEVSEESLTTTAEHAGAAGDSPRVARNFGALVGGQLVTWSMTLLWTLIVPRLLGPDSYGKLVAAISVSGVLGLFLGMGTRPYLVREIVIRPDEAPKLVGTAVILRVLVSPLVVCAAIAFAMVAHYKHDQAILLYLAVVVNVATLTMDPMQATFQALQRMKYLAFADIINKTAQSLVGIVIAVAGLGAIGIVSNMAVVACAVLVLNLFWLRRYVRIDLRTNTRLIARMFKESLSFWAAGLFFTIYLWIDTVMLSLMTDSKIVGWYGAATTLFQTLSFIPVLLATAWLPPLVAAFGHGRRRLYETARKPLEVVLVISAPIAAGTAMAAPTMIHILYGTGYAHAAPALVILALTLPPTYVNIITNQVLLAERRQIVCTWVAVAAAVLNPLLNLFLIPATVSRYHNGAIGAALALLLTEVFITVLNYFFVSRRVLNVSMIKRLSLAVLASGFMWLVAWFARPLGTPVALTAGVLTLLLLTWAWRIPTDDEVAWVRARLSRLPVAGRIFGSG